MVLGVFLAVVSSSQNQAIHFEAKGMSVQSTLESLSQATGTTLKANGPLGQQIVFVKVDGVKPEDLKRRLADVLGATWMPKDGVEYLTRTPAQENAIWTRHVELRGKLVQVSLEQARKQVAQPFSGADLARGLVALKPSDNNADRAQANLRHRTEKALFDQAPTARLLNRLILACDPKDLAAVGPFERRIFCLKPTRMQRGINAKAFQTALAAFAKEQAEWVDAASKVGFPEDPSGRMVSDPRTQIEYTAKDMEDVQLEVKRGEMVSLFMVNLKAAHPSHSRSIFCQVSFADPGRTFMNSMMDAKPAPESDPVVPLSEESEEFQKRLTGTFMSQDSLALSPRMLQMLLNVDQRDPLAWTPSDAFASYADFKKLNVVGVLPDDAVSLGAFVAGQGKLRTEQFVRALTGYGSITLTEADGWATFAPADEWEASTAFTPRKPLAKLIKAVNDKGRLDVHDYARFAFESRLLNRGTLPMMFLGMYDRSILGSSDQTSWDGLRLYGSFAPIAQQDLEGGRQFAFGGLSGEQRKIVERIVYGDMIQSEERLDGSTAQLNHEPVEPTEAYPNGLPAGGFVTAKTKSVSVIVAYGKDKDGKIRPLRALNAYTLATIEVEVVGNAKQMAMYGVPDLVGYAPGTDKMVSLRVQTAPGLWKECAIVVPDYDSKATPVSWDKLPEPLKSQIAAGIQEIKQRKQQQGGGTIPPCSFVN